MLTEPNPTLEAVCLVFTKAKQQVVQTARCGKSVSDFLVGHAVFQSQH